MSGTHAPSPLRVLCPQCLGQNPECFHCVGGYITKDPYDQRTSGEQREDFEDVRPTAPQPLPRVGLAEHSVDLVVADLAERKRHGIAKYGVAHQHDNGRDHLVDRYQELLDAVIYTRAEIEQRRGLQALARAARDQINSGPIRALIDAVETFATGRRP